MKNKFETNGDITTITLRRRDGTLLYTIIDTEDLERANEFPGTWYANLRYGQFYVKGAYPLGNSKQKTVYLHRWLFNPPHELRVDHMNHDTLDNRRSKNLRLVPPIGNSQNFNRASKRSSSGLLNVFRRKKKTGIKWEAIVVHKGAKHWLGIYADKYEASAVVKRFREQHLPYSFERLNTDQ